jgi:hypothetical protein
VTSSRPRKDGGQHESGAAFHTQDREAQRSSEERIYLQAQLDDLLRNHIDVLSRYSWALAVATELARRPRGLIGFLAQCLPYGLWHWLLARRLRRKGLFDVQAYRRRYPDTERSKFGPLAHFLRWGIKEGRPGGPNEPLGAVSEAPADIVRVVQHSSLFDPQWYGAHYGFVSESPEAAVRDYLAQSRVDQLRNPGPLFSGAYYLLQNPDTAGVNPLVHYLTCGLSEGRRAISPAAADAFMEGSTDETLSKLDDLLDPAKPTLVLCWEEGNFFFADIATYLCEYLSARGYQAERAFDEMAFEVDRHNIVVVAPHEYCIHGPGKAWSIERLHEAIYVNTEQWHTSWFSLALGVMSRSGKVLDINPASARGLCRLGMKAGFLPLVPTESITFTFPNAPLSAQTAELRAVKPLTYAEDLAQRAYDVLYVAALNERRARILSRIAPNLARHDCFLHTPLLQGPVNASSANMIPSADFNQLARNSRILLNIHQGESRYFEWHRLFVSGICEGCVVVTEPCIDTGMLTAGIHFLEIEAGLMGEYVDWLLLTVEGKQKMEQVYHSCSGFRDGLISIELV